jgi:molecular chaperone DnaK (HSP70)
MAEGATPSLGLSIGATNLAAVTAEVAITRKPVLTLFRQRPPEVGVPSENPRLDEPGLVMSDFVDRVGDPIAIVAADGSVHRSEALATDGLRALAYTATGGRPLPDGVAVTYPAHWGPKAADALGSALSRVSEWTSRARPLTVISDAEATLFAVRANPGIPAGGIVAVCDFGGSGTSITLVDAAAGEYQPLAPTVRHHDFSGDLIDQALLTAVMDNVPSSGPFDPAGTSAIGSLTRLRAACRSAKEQLSSSTVTTLSDELPGLGGDVRLARSELGDAIRDPLDNFLTVLQDTLARNKVRGSDLVAVVSVGGGANIPVVTTMLSGRLRVPVVTTPRPHLTAAIGGALRASHGLDDAITTKMAAAAPEAANRPARRPDFAPAGPGGSRGSGAAGSAPDGVIPRPSLNSEQEAQGKQRPRWYRLPAAVLIATAVAMLGAGIAVVISLNSDDKPATAPGVSSTAISPAPTTAAPANDTATP